VKKSHAAVAVSIALTAVLLTPLAANATDNPVVSPTAQNTLKAFWTEWGVPAATQDALIAKANSGQKLDVLDGSAPVGERTVTSGDTTTTVETYADGSIGVIAVGPVVQAAGRIQPMTAGSTSCHKTSGTATSNTYKCAVSMDIGWIAMSYNASYTNYAAQPARINSVSSQMSWTCVGACTVTHQPHIVRTVDTPSASALAQADLNFNILGWASGNEWLRFSVHNGAASASYN
jgi:hypothetical protein